ncbi:DUF2007 domain-containing protein [Psychromonas sp. RZ22]|uniref:putative signal transducing protein n=1 Tax=Psychromonas algarum TaxID=2555643 RepID=UPI0010676388|nr:DUF2007 domain-containing protein [Psychromonas sp. RZ22]TEW54851.1 DUF2007 domain-containing protein [Psychromonas sp. RZ22]
MKMIYTNENIFITNNLKNILEAQGINTFIKNEFSQGAIGGVSVFDAWPEVWVFDNADFERAQVIANSLQSSKGDIDWVCEHCSEHNESVFEICWNCQSEN